MIKFTAEVKQVKSTKSVSNDRVFTVVFVTEDPKVLELGASDPQSTVNVSVE